MNRLAFLVTGLAVLPLASFAARSPQGVIVIGADLNAAKAAYAAETRLSRRDCDPVGDGRWLCASYANPTLAQFSSATDPSSQPVAVSPNPMTPVTPDVPATPTPASSDRVAVIASTLSQARMNFAQTTSQRRVDCDSVPDGRWICASFNNPSLSDVGASSGGDSTGGSTPVVRPTPVPVPRPSNGRRALESDALYRPGDLIVLNYDSCPDPDDLHAAVAGRMVVDYYGFELGEDYIVNNGTCGDRRPRSDYIQNSPRVFNALYGREGSTSTWQDVFNNESRGARATADKMAITLTQGRKVWVMDGGPSDFTFETLKLLQAQNLGVSLKNVVVVQHSAGFNQREADQSHLAFVRNTTDYRLINDGNNRNNQTPQLNQNRRDSSRYSVPDASIISRFRDNAVYGSAWRVAFDLLNPNQRLDGSDTVELLWILGLRSNDIAGWTDFANRFLPTRSSSSPSTPAPAPAPAATPSTPAATSGLRAQVESATLRGGWQRTAEGAIWLGPDRYALSQRGDDANLSYSLTVPAAGRYRFTMRSRATPRGLTAARYSVEPPNDVWVTFGSRSWIKAYMNRDGQWHTTATGELGSNRSASNLESDLPAGRVIVTISGRSRGHEIDYIELVRIR